MCVFIIKTKTRLSQCGHSIANIKSSGTVRYSIIKKKIKQFDTTHVIICEKNGTMSYDDDTEICISCIKQTCVSSR